MAKKIYDIIPPKEEPIVVPVKTVAPVVQKAEFAKAPKKSAVVAQKVSVENNANTPNNPVIKPAVIEPVLNVSPPFAKINEEYLPQDTNQLKKKSPVKIIAFVCGVLLLVVVGYFYFSLQKVNVQIWPTIETLTFKETIIADKSVQAVDEEKNLIPGKLFSEQKSLTQTFTATGKTSSSTKAEGTIKVYNKLTPASPISLKAGTHFLSDSGKYYVSLDKISIPAGKNVSGKFVPGSIDVKVVAEDVGDSYNAKSAKFSVPKLVGTAYYYSVYGEATNITGGSTGQANQVTFEDIQKAKEAISKDIINQLETNLKSKITEEYLFLETEIKKNVTDSSTSAKTGLVADNFDYQAKAEVKIMAFKKADVEKYAKDYILNKMAKEKVFLDNSLVVNYVAKKTDLDAGKMAFDLNFSGKTYHQINNSDLISLFREKNQQEIQDVISRNLGENVLKFKINFSPFWTMRAPSNPNKITLDLKFE